MSFFLFCVFSHAFVIIFYVGYDDDGAYDDAQPNDAAKRRWNDAHDESHERHDAESESESNATEQQSNATEQQSNATHATSSESNEPTTNAADTTAAATIAKYPTTANEQRHAILEFEQWNGKSSVWQYQRPTHEHCPHQSEHSWDHK